MVELSIVRLSSANAAFQIALNHSSKDLIDILIKETLPNLLSSS